MSYNNTSRSIHHLTVENIPGRGSPYPKMNLPVKTESPTSYNCGGGPMRFHDTNHKYSNYNRKYTNSQWHTSKKNHNFGSQGTMPTVRDNYQKTSSSYQKNSHFQSEDRSEYKNNFQFQNNHSMKYETYCKQETPVHQYNNCQSPADYFLSHEGNHSSRNNRSYQSPYEKDSLDDKPFIKQECFEPHSTMNSTTSTMNSTTSSNGFRSPHVLKKSYSGWYYVRLLYAHKFSCWEYAEELTTYFVQPIEFKYYNMRFLEHLNMYSFFVSDFELAQKLYSTGRDAGRCQTKDQLNFLVTSTSPYFEVSEDMMKTIAVVISKRYKPCNYHLDLSRFHDDPDFLSQNCFVPLDRPGAFKSVFSIVASTLPDLESIDLSHNRIFFRDCLTTVAHATPKVKFINLNNNHINEMKDLVGLRTLNLRELILTGNPLVERSLDRHRTVLDITNLFPTLIKFNDMDVTNLDKKVECEQSLECECERLLPVKSSPSFFYSADSMLFTKEFIEKYFELFDSSRRRVLEPWYHEDAQFSLVSIDGKGKNSTVSSLIKSSRNLLRMKDETRQESLLYCGRQNIVAFLETLPSLRHDPGSLTCDCSLMSSALVHLSISGLYENLSPSYLNIGRKSIVDSKRKSLLSFSRSFVFTPNCDGKFLISNDQMFVTNPTADQYIRAFASLNGLQLAFVKEEEDEDVSVGVKQHLSLIKGLALATGVSLNCAEDYLVNNEWDYDRSLENIRSDNPDLGQGSSRD